MDSTKLEVAYLEKCNDLVLRIEACDATSSLATSELVQSLDKPLGGAVLMTMRLSDGLFANQTEEGFKNVMDVKWGALTIFNGIQPIKDLDFFVSFSSVASVFGNAGQTNYSAAHSVVDGFLDKFPNSFSIVIPAVSDLGYFARMSESSPALANFLSWSITSQRKYLSVSQ